MTPDGSTTFMVQLAMWSGQLSLSLYFKMAGTICVIHGPQAVSCDKQAELADG